MFTLLLAFGTSLYAARRHDPAQSAPAQGSSAEKAPAQSDKVANAKDQKAPEPQAKAPAQEQACPPGQKSVTRESPFGPMKGCEVADTANAPAVAPATPAPAAKSDDGVTVQTGAPKPSPAPSTPSSSTSTGAPVNAPANTPANPATQGSPAAGAPATSEGEKSGQQPKTQDGKQIEQMVTDGAIQLNLENADLYQVLRILGPELKINTIIDPGVKGSVTINTSTSVSRKDLFGLLEMILEINGATAVKQPNGYYAIVPMGAAKQQPANFHFEKQAQPSASDEGFVLHVIAMKFMSAGEMAKVLTPYMSPGGQIVVQDRGNLLLISDGAAKMSQLEQLVNMFDDPVLGRQRVRLIPVKYNLAENLIPELKAIFQGYGLTSAPAVQLLSMDRQNSILAISAAPEVFKEVEEWVQKLDQPSQEMGVRIFVYKVQNAKAGDLAGIIGALYGRAPAGTIASQSGEGGAAGAAGGGGTAALNPANVMGPPNGSTGAAAAGGGAAAGGAQGVPATAEIGAAVQLSSNLKIMADDKNNQLVIQATPHDYEVLQRTLQELDILPRQVLIDARIYQVDLTGDLSVGLSAFLDKKNNLNPIATSGSFSVANALSMQTFAILHNSYELQLFLTASENRTRVKTLSSPSILVTDNTAARIQVGSEVPVPIGSAITPVQSGGSSVFAQTIQMRDIGVILSVTPRINASGIVTIEIQQEVSSAVPNTTSAIVAPVINKSQFQTKAILRDGETLALGGIISTSNSLTKNRIPLLGDIPGIGALFGSTGSNSSRKELVLLLTPHVAKDMEEANSISSEFVHRMHDLKKEIQKTPSMPKSR